MMIIGRAASGGGAGSGWWPAVVIVVVVVLVGYVVSLWLAPTTTCRAGRGQADRLCWACHGTGYTLLHGRRLLHRYRGRQ